jgi:hypothetical protein
MERKNLLIGIIVVSVIIAAAATLQSRQYSYQKAEPALLERPTFEQVKYEEALFDEAVEVAEESGILPPGAARAPGAEPVPQEQRLIKTSYISLEVETFPEAADEIGAIARKYGGYVSDSSVQDYEGRKIGYVTVRVPQQDFEDAVKEIEAVGTLEEERISIEDVTEQYIDLKARLENAKNQEEAYLEILNMATTVEDVLKVEIQLERIRSDIESLQGRLNYMENRTNFSTVQVRLSEPEKITHESGIGRAFSQAIDAFLSAVRGIIIFLGFFIPIAFFLTCVALLGRFVYRKWFKEH